MSERYDQRVILIVSAADRDAANRSAEAAVPGAGGRTFAVGLVPAGSPPGTPPTHYIASWSATAAQRDRLRVDFDRADWGRGYLTWDDTAPSVEMRVSDLLRVRGLVFEAQANAVGRLFDGGVR